MGVITLLKQSFWGIIILLNNIFEVKKGNLFMSSLEIFSIQPGGSNNCQKNNLRQFL
jgi:hypothetical protein